MTFEAIRAIFQIILIDIVLSGDNAVVIAMAARKLPVHQRNRAILWGGGIAILMRIVFTLIVSVLLMVPGLRLLGGIVLMWIAVKLLVEEEEHLDTSDEAAKSAWAAIRMIFIADFVMSLDNMLAVAGAAHGNTVLLLMGLIVSIAIIMTSSSLIAGLMNRYRWIVYLGAGILAYTAGEMMLGDRELAGYFVRDRGVMLSRDWKEWMLTEQYLRDPKPFEALPEDLQSRVFSEHGRTAFIGQMDEAQRDLLLNAATNADDKHVVEKMYEKARAQPVPGWVPQALAPRVQLWFQNKWPAEYWEKAKNNEQFWFSWVFLIGVVVVSVTAPLWWPKPRQKPPAPAENQNPA